MPGDLWIKQYGNSMHDELTLLMKIAFDRALYGESNITEACLAVRGMSGIRYRMFINNLVRLFHRPRYLEVGSWGGSTACSAMDKNKVDVVCIDNWSEFGGPKELFFENISTFRYADSGFDFIEGDFRSVDLRPHGLFNIYLFDGPHAEKDQYDGLHLYEAALENDFVFIVDDWNWSPVRSGTLNAIRDTGLRIDYSIDVRTTMNNGHGEVHGEAGDWHNGYFMAKLSREKPRY